MLLAVLESSRPLAAAKKGYAQIVDLLIRAPDAKLDGATASGETHIQAATQAGFETVAKLLLAAGASQTLE